MAGVNESLMAPETVSKSKRRPSSSKSKRIACFDPLSMSLVVSTITLGEVDFEPDRLAQTTASPRRCIIDDMEIVHRHHSKLLADTLHLLNASEVVASSEYLDVAFSFLYQLAFVLEKYWMDVQDRIAGCITLMVVLNTVHQGMALDISACVVIPIKLRYPLLCVLQALI
jgi:hypothetical protein